MIGKIRNFILKLLRLFDSYLVRKSKLRKNLQTTESLKLNFGCGGHAQEGYLNVDIRVLPKVDIMADMGWCSRHLRGKCKEVYISHVLEHFGQPGKSMNCSEDSVLHLLNQIHKMLVPQGIIRIAVPDFHALAKLYLNHHLPLYPRIIGRICGEQHYRQNQHKCIFDRQFLEFCLKSAGFANITTWDPKDINFKRDSSFDEINGTKTSLNLIAEKVV